VFCGSPQVKLDPYTQEGRGWERLETSSQKNGEHGVFGTPPNGGEHRDGVRGDGSLLKTEQHAYSWGLTSGDREGKARTRQEVLPTTGWERKIRLGKTHPNYMPSDRGDLFWENKGNRNQGDGNARKSPTRNRTGKGPKVWLSAKMGKTRKTEKHRRVSTGLIQELGLPVQTASFRKPLGANGISGQSRSLNWVKATRAMGEKGGKSKKDP